jgi:hypothetical protein
MIVESTICQIRLALVIVSGEKEEREEGGNGRKQMREREERNE